MERTKKGLSLKWGLVAIIAFCWIVPLTAILLYSSHSIQQTVSARVNETISSSVDNAIENVELQIENAMEASRAPSYDKVIKSAYEKYEVDNDNVKLYETVTNYLLDQYGYNNLFNSTFLYFTSMPDTIYYASNRLDAGEIYGIQEYKETIHLQIEQSHQDLGTKIGFLKYNDKLYMVRNIVNSSFDTFAVIVMECDNSKIFESLNSIVWLSNATVIIDDIYIDLFSGDEAYANETNLLINKNVTISGHKFEFDISANNTLIMKNIPDFSKTLMLLSVLTIPLLLFAFWAYYHYVASPLNKLVEASEKMEEGNRGYTIKSNPGSREFNYLYDSFNAMSVELDRQFNHIYHEQQALQDARVKALRSQINPHFLNNTLEAVSWAARMGDNEKVCRMIESLSIMLDAATARGARARGTLKQELTYADAYLYILSERLGDRVTVTKNIEQSALTALVPCLILQPIVENAYEHGIAICQTGILELRCYLQNNSLFIQVENTGTMTDEDKMRIKKSLSWENDAYSINNNSECIGIQNVNRRLKILCGERAGLTIEETNNNTVIATIRIDDVEFDKKTQ